jgi:hypothetical protein
MQNTSLTIAALQTKARILIYSFVNSGSDFDLRLALTSLGCFAEVAIC